VFFSVSSVSSVVASLIPQYASRFYAAVLTMATLAILRNDLSCYLRDKPRCSGLHRSDRLHHAVRYLTQPQAGPAPTIALIDRDTRGRRSAAEEARRLGYKVHRTATAIRTSGGSRSSETRRVDGWLAAGPHDATRRRQESAQERSVRFDLESALARSPCRRIVRRDRDRGRPLQRHIAESHEGFQRTVPAI